MNPPNLRVLIAGLLVAACARAADRLLPPIETGFVCAGGGLRLVPQTDLLAEIAKAGAHATPESALRPAVQVAVAYRVDRAWGVEVGAGWSNDAYGFDDETRLGFSTFTLTLGGSRAMDVGLGWLEPYVGFGGGYWVSTATTSKPGDKERVEESGTTGLYGAIGVRAALGESFGLVVEDRYALAVASLEKLGLASVGGNTLSVLFYGIWRG